MILVSFGLVNNVTENNIKPGFKSDHSMPLIDLNLVQCEKGPVYWKMNTSHLDEAAYISSIKNIIEDRVANNNETESLLLWDAINQVSSKRCYH